MTWRDKLEIGLKEDAEFRKDNLPPSEVHGPQLPAGPGRSPIIPLARDDHDHAATPPRPPARRTPDGLAAGNEPAREARDTRRARSDL